MTARTRLLLVLLPYITIFYATFLAGMNGDDTLGLLSFLLAGAGLFVIIQATWLRGRLNTTGVLVWNPIVLTTLGLLFGISSRGEAATGLAGGLIVGLLTSPTALWLGSLTQLKRRPRIFLSYRRADSADVTAHLYQALAKRYYGRNVFVDIETMRPGTDFRIQIAKTIKRCDAVFVVMAERWLDIRDDQGRRRLNSPDDLVRIEIETALVADVVVVPVLVDAARVPAQEDLPEELRPLAYRHAVSLRRGPDFDADVARLVAKFEESFRPYTTESVALPPPKASLARRLAVAAISLSLLLPFGWRLLDEATSGPRTLHEVVVSPDGTRVATIHRGSTLRIWNLITGTLEKIHKYPSGDPWLTAVVWSPDSRSLATGDSEGGLVLRDPATLGVKRVLAGYQGNVDPATLSWSPDGTRLAASDQLGTVHVWRADSGEHLASKNLFSHWSRMVTWSPRGNKLAVTGWYTNSLFVLVVLAAEESELKLIYEFTDHRSSVNQIAWAPDGTRLASAGYDMPYLVLHSVSMAGFTSRALPEQSNVEDLRWSPDGRMLATVTGGYDSVVRLWDTAGTLRQQLLMHDAYEPRVAWSPDSSSIASADKTAVRVWSVKDGRSIARWSQRQDFLGTKVVAWTSEGRIVTYSLGDDTVRVWRIDAATHVAAFNVTIWDLL